MERLRKPLRVLVVDDNRDAADSLVILLRLWGHYADAVYDGANALVTARSLKSQVLILDMCMPQMHGGELAAQLRSDPLFKTALIIVASASPPDEFDPYGEFFDETIGKPYNLTVLENLLEAYASARK